MGDEHTNASSGTPGPRRRRARYAGTHPKRFDQKYKELDPAAYPEMQQHVRAQGRTPAGTHISVMVEEVLAALRPQPGEIAVDCTIGHGGHAIELLKRISPTGRLIGLDVDGAQLERTRDRLKDTLTEFPPSRGVAYTRQQPLPAGGPEPAPDDNARCIAPLGASTGETPVPHRLPPTAGAATPSGVSLHRSHFAGLGKVLAREGLTTCDIALADLGVSSMQIDDPSRGFSYKQDGPLDMRMDDRLKRTAADLLADLSLEKLTEGLFELADEPDAERIAKAIVSRRADERIERTRQLVKVVLAAKGLSPRDWRERRHEQPGELHPAARTFQALRILVNDEMAGLEQFLRIVPYCLRTGGRVAIISFHSGEDRRVESAFAEGLAAGVYSSIAKKPIRPAANEVAANPRSRSALLRWAVRVSDAG